MLLWVGLRLRLNAENARGTFESLGPNSKSLSRFLDRGLRQRERPHGCFHLEVDAGVLILLAPREAECVRRKVTKHGFPDELRDRVHIVNRKYCRWIVLAASNAVRHHLLFERRERFTAAQDTGTSRRCGRHKRSGPRFQHDHQQSMRLLDREVAVFFAEEDDGRDHVYKDSASRVGLVVIHPKRTAEGPDELIHVMQGINLLKPRFREV